MAKRGKLAKFATEASEQRPIKFRRYQYLFLIVCEDQKTERVYFERFKSQIPSETIYLETIGTGLDAKGVVEKTLEERTLLAQRAKREVDVTWSVFDVDDANINTGKAQRFQDACKIGEESNIQLAYSNEVFELWLLLHLTAVDSQKPLPRAEVYRLLEEQVRRRAGHEAFEYTHGDTQILDKVHSVGNQEIAIERAADLLKQHGKREPLNANPSTKVHLLVQDLLRWIRYYTYSPE